MKIEIINNITKKIKNYDISINLLICWIMIVTSALTQEWIAFDVFFAAALIIDAVSYKTERIIHDLMLNDTDGANK